MAPCGASGSHYLPIDHRASKSVCALPHFACLPLHGGLSSPQVIDKTAILFVRWGWLKAWSVAPFGSHPCLIDVEYVTHLTITAGTRGTVIGRGYTADTIHFVLAAESSASIGGEGAWTGDVEMMWGSLWILKWLKGDETKGPWCFLRGRVVFIGEASGKAMMISLHFISRICVVFDVFVYHTI